MNHPVSAQPHLAARTAVVWPAKCIIPRKGRIRVDTGIIHETGHEVRRPRLWRGGHEFRFEQEEEEKLPDSTWREGAPRRPAWTCLVGEDSWIFTLLSVSSRPGNENMQSEVGQEP